MFFTPFNINKRKAKLFPHMNAVIKKSFPLSKENGKDIKSIFIIFPRQGSSAFTKPAVLGSLNYDIIDINICQDFFTVFTEISPEFRTS